MSFGRKGLVAGQNIGTKARSSAPLVQVAHDAQPESYRFDITPKPWASGLMAIICAVAGYFMLRELADPRGVIINNLITLGPVGADIFFGLLFLVCAGSTILACANLKTGLTKTVWLRLEGDAIEGWSNPFSRQSSRIPYAQIRNVSVRQQGRHYFATIKGWQGETIRTASANFRSKTEFSRFLELLSERVG